MRESVFQFPHYRDCLRWLLEKSNTQAKGQKSRLAEFMGCQPAYLSRVMGEEADLSLEQGEAVSRFFPLKPAEASYFLALLGEARAGTPELRQFWKKRKEEALLEGRELKGRIQAKMSLSKEDQATYFSEWIYAAIHVSVSVEGLQTVERLAAHLSLGFGRVRAALHFLCAVGLVKEEKGRYLTGESKLFLEKESPLVGRHHLNWMLKSMEAINQPVPTDLQYTSVVSLSRADLEKVREIIFSAIENVRKVVAPSEAETVICYHFDFFELGRQPMKG
jgi:uncharacterized protein (TIGR02147 family)